MSGLNVSVGYFLVAFALSQVAHPLLNSLNLGNFHNELLASFLLVACWLELQILVELGAWAGGFGLDVSLTLLFLILVIQGLSGRGASGNPSITMQSFLLSKISFLTAFGSMIAHFVGAMFAKLLAKYYWSLELIDMHMFHNMMAQECSPTLRVSVLQGAFTEGICMLILHLLAMRTEELSALLRATIFAATNTLLTCMANSYTLGLFNPVLAFALTFHCAGYSFLEYATVYWLGPTAGMIVAVFFHHGHIPLLSHKNWLFSQKSRYRIPKQKNLPILKRAASLIWGKRIVIQKNGGRNANE
ncbi:aquaporin 12 [Erpetoichthys calabaricus]|uniref:aquaporin 12 n=1 Tax=Erpetoichthys calabaricus TaxID=27687 RepID=UPI0022340D4D|nr:aquaporin 12 [Erpetoichthys calabaricus]